MNSLNHLKTLRGHLGSVLRVFSPSFSRPKSEKIALPREKTTGGAAGRLPYCG